jgi:hypothetical protein
MKLRATIIDWEYPPEPAIPAARVFDLAQKNDLLTLTLAFGNGTILEMRAEADSHETLDTLRGLAQGTGACHPRQLTPTERQTLWLYQDGFEVYARDGSSPTYLFINPVPQPKLF